MLLMWLACISDPPPKPDVLLVVLDTVRADRLSSYGYARATDTQLVEIANAGVLFEDVTAPSSWTWPSHASLFTGAQPWEHAAHRSKDGVAIEGSDWSVSLMREDIPTLAESFSKAGYETLAYSTNSLLDPELGLMRGFSESVATSDEAKTMALAQAALERDRDKPLFLFVNLMTAHAPYLVAEFVPWSAQHKRDFDIRDQPLDWAKPFLFTEYPGLNLPYYVDSGLNGEMLYTKGELSIPSEDLIKVGDLYDGELMRLNQMLRTLILRWGNRRGMVAVTSDHGEYLGEKHRIGHGVDLDPSVLSVPLVIAYPGVIEPGTRRTEPVEMRRLGATLLDLADIPVKEGFLSSSYSLRRPQEGSVEAGVWGFRDWETSVGPQYGVRRRWIREGQWAAAIDETGRGELYNTTLDPLCTRNVASNHADVYQRFVQTAQQSFSAEYEN
ncbi:MAG: sulfatase-like hydrolase/transferase, partial [Myxococcota bacterium]|nr:sulfatase-like hydrolase/transferase [Myxococcota bacterium]